MDTFTILPSASSMMMEMSIVIILVFFYLIYISYLSAYNTGFKPNFVMFINFLFDDYSGTTNFQTYIKNIVEDKKSNEENFTIQKRPKTINKIFTNIKYNFNKLISKSYINGNKLTITRTI
jgi:hypothetical protein